MSFLSRNASASILRASPARTLRRVTARRRAASVDLRPWNTWGCLTKDGFVVAVARAAEEAWWVEEEEEEEEEGRLFGRALEDEAMFECGV